MVSSVLGVPSYAAALAVFAVAYFVVYPVVVYFRDAKGLRKFHNMSQFSGMSNIPFMILAHGGARSTYLAKLHKKQPILRTGPNALSFGSVLAIKDIYGHGTPCLKDESYEISAGSDYHLADVIDRADHARKRRVLSAAYAIKNLQEWEFKVADKVERLFKKFDSCCTDPLPKGQIYPDPNDVNVDYRQWTNYFTLDAITDIGLSESLGLLDRGNDTVTARRPDGTTYEVDIRQALYPTARKQSLLIWSYENYKLLDKISNLIPFYRRMSESAVNWEAIVQNYSHRRLERYKAGQSNDDFFQSLMESKKGEANNLPWGEVVAEVNIMMNAGSVTTAIALTNCLYELLKHPQVLSRLSEEVDAALDPDEIVAPYSKVKNLPYLKACLDESLRLQPPTPHGLPRTTPPEGLNIMGEYVPGNTTVSISALVAHRDESVFPEAEKFIPERWLGEKGKSLQSSFITFSTGGRGCIGRNITYLEQIILMASLVHRYEFAMPKGFQLQRLETMNHILGEMPIKVWRRTV
ncbi:cytochrome P450 [Xylaria arbuscula]|nr:cytochrome P450 [Xylaria arbuscula]